MAKEQFARYGVPVIRVIVGAFFLYEAASQLRKGWIGGDGLERMIRSAIRGHDILPPFKWFLEDVVIEYDQLFTVLSIAGELAVGVAIVMGLLTRLTALVALFMNVNFLMLNGLTVGGLIDAIWIVFELLIIAFAVRQAWSADGWLARRGFYMENVSGAPPPP